MVVESSPASPERDDEYDQWYSKIHMPEVLAVPGFLAGRRYRVPAGADSAHAYLAVYEIEADDLTAPFAELRARSASGVVQRSDVVGVDPAPVIRFYEFVEEQQAQP
jgi:hypothetical protein